MGARQLHIVNEIAVHYAFQEQFLVVVDPNDMDSQIPDDLGNNPYAMTTAFLETQEASLIGRNQNTACTVSHLGDGVVLFTRL